MYTNILSLKNKYAIICNNTRSDHDNLKDQSPRNPGRLNLDSFTRFQL